MSGIPDGRFARAFNRQNLPMKISFLLTETRRLRRVAALSLAVVFGAGAFALLAPMEALAAGTTTMCYRNTTIEVPNSMVSKYQARGATLGACPVTPS